MSDLRERVAEAVWINGGHNKLNNGETFAQRPDRIRHYYLSDADAAIRAVIEALAAEAEVPYPNEDPRLDYTEYGGGHVVNMGALVASWLRGHLGDTEATG